MGNGCCGQFIICCLCFSLLLRGRTPHFLPLFQCVVLPTGDSPPQTSAKGVFPMGQFFINCSSGDHFQGVQSFRNRLIHHGSPVGSYVMPTKVLYKMGSCLYTAKILLQCRLPMGHGFLWALTGSSTASSMDHYGLQHGLQEKLSILVFGVHPLS